MTHRVIGKKIWFLSLLLVSIIGFSQNKNQDKKHIDSIFADYWHSAAPDMDSLANTVIEEIPDHFKDTLIIADEGVRPQPLEELPVTPFNLINIQAPKKWYFYGQNNVIFNQSSFSNWNAGGNNNIGVIGKINYNLSYKNRKHYLENNLQLGYGFVTSAGQSTRKTEDYINLMTNYGYELGRNYYLSAGYQFLSQFTNGYNYYATPEPNNSDRISRFMAPGYLNAGLGISYNPNENFQVIFRPVNGKFTFVTDPLLQKKGRYGLEYDGQSMRSELGAMLNVTYRIKFYENVNMDNQLGFFSNYISHAERVDIAYNGMLNIRFNRFINTVVALDLIYDHDQIRRLQLKQTLGVGFSYNLGAENREVPKKKIIKPFVEK